MMDDGLGKEVNLDDEIMKSVAKKIMNETTQKINVNFKTLNVCEKKDIFSSRSKREEELNYLTRGFQEILYGYTEMIHGILWKTYCEQSSLLCMEEYQNFLQRIQTRISSTKDVFGEEKKRYEEIRNRMLEKEKLSTEQVNKFALYFPFEVESRVCFSLMPYTKSLQYIKNNEQYNVECIELDHDVDIRLYHEAKDIKKTIFIERTKISTSTTRKSCSTTKRRSDSGYYVDSDKSKLSIGQKLRSEVEGTAMFISSFFDL